jgi:hypothetical protein
MIAWGAGNDTLMLDRHFASNDGHLDMGTGDNTLSVAANGLNITSSDTSHVSNVDHIDTTGFGANTVTLDAADVISVADSTTHTLRFDGDGGTDGVALGGDGAGPGGWHELNTAGQSVTVNGTNYTTNASGEVVIGGQTYDAYQWHADGNVAGAIGATVLINHALDVTNHVNVTDQI